MNVKFSVETLRGFQGKRVILRSTEGEVLEAEILTVFEEEKDLNYRMISTNQPEWYAGRKGTYVIPFEYIADIKLAE